MGQMVRTCPMFFNSVYELGDFAIGMKLTGIPARSDQMYRLFFYIQH